MSVYVFHDGGYEKKTIIVRADSELEARGKVQEKTKVGIDPQYRGTLDELSSESDVLEMSDLS